MKPLSRRTLALVFAAAATLSSGAQTSTPQLIASASAPPVFASVVAAEPPLIESPSVEAMPSVASSDSAIPDAPSAVLGAPVFAMDAPAASGGTAAKYALVISAGDTAQKITAGDKVVIAFRELYNPLSLLGSLVSAGYSQAVNGAPNYGTNSTAFGKRFGAAVARGSSQEVFTNGVFAPILHIDPRYYVLGSDYNFGHRAFYAVTRVLVSKTDGGRTTLNAPLLLGYAGATGLSNVYYPQINRNFKDSAAEYGGSLGGAAIGFVVNEFADGILKALHMKSK